MSDGKLIDLSHTVEHGMITYKGLPAPIICDYLSREASRARYAEGTEFQIGKIEMVANTGTYIDSPFHRYAHGKDLSELKLESLANLDCVVVRATERTDRAIDRFPIDLATLQGKALLVHTGWDAHWRTDRYFEGHPHLTGDLAEQLVERRRHARRHRFVQHRFAPMTELARSIPPCSAPGFPSWSISAAWPRCPIEARAFLPCR